MTWGKKVFLAIGLLALCATIAYVAWAYWSCSRIHWGAVCSAVVILAFLLYLSVALYKGELRTARSTVRDHRLWAPILALVALAIVSVLLSCPSGLNVEFVSKPGVIFVLSLAIVTVLGFLLTISRIEDIHGRILDYSHLLERCADLAEMEKGRVDKKGFGRVTLLANAPAFGNVSAPKEFEVFFSKLKFLIPHPDVEVDLLCLPWTKRRTADGQEVNPLDQFYDRHWGDEPEVDLPKKIEQSKEIIRWLVKQGGTNKVAHALIPWAGEVPFHLFMTTDKAILFTTLSFPKERAKGDDSGESHTEGRTRRREKVEVVGVETGDHGILRALNKAVESRLHDRGFASVDSAWPESG